VDNEDRFGTHHQNSDLSFLDSGQELHVNKHALITNDVFFTEIHELPQLSMLYVVVNSFSALDFGVERKNVSSFVFSLVFDLNAPDTLTSGSSVLLQDSLGVGKSFRESLSEIFHLVVDVGIIRNKFGLVELHEG